jgi:hypothetical protein
MDSHEASKAAHVREPAAQQRFAGDFEARKRHSDDGPNDGVGFLASIMAHP